MQQNSTQSISMYSVYKYLDGQFMALLIIGIMSALMGGIGLGGGFFIIIVIMTKVTNEVTDHDLHDDLLEVAFIELGIVAFMFVCCFILYTCLHLVGQKVTYEYRWRYMKALLTKDSYWFDEQNLEEIPGIVNTNLSEIENSSGKTLGFICYSISGCISGIGFSFMVSSLLATCCLVVPIIVFAIGGFNMYVIEKTNKAAERNYLKTGADVEQTTNAIKIVKAFSQENYEVSKYEKHLRSDDKNQNKNAVIYGLSLGLLESAYYICMLYVNMIGGVFVIEKIKNSNFDRNHRFGDYLGVFMLLSYGCYSLGL